MRTFCAFICLFLSVQYFISCQKELRFDDPSIPPGDSLTLVKTIRAIDYHSNDVFLYEERQVFNYDKSLNRTVVEIADSDRYNPGQLKRYTATFQYDAGDRLSQYITTGGYEPATQIDFAYNTAGDISKTTMRDQWVGKTIDCYYGTTTQNNQKTIMVYDTSGVYNANADSRPEISKYIFDASNRLVNETIYYTIHRQPQNWFVDTFETKYFYDNNNFINKVITTNAYRPNPDNPATIYWRDSAQYTSEGNTAALRNSFLYVYRNMYWLNISEYGTGFANAINKGYLLPYSGQASKTGEYWKSDPPDPAVQEHALGTYQNTFDANGLLTGAVFPKKFANKYGGKTELFYTYTKIKK
jgi:hypothetical protein